MRSPQLIKPSSYYNLIVALLTHNIGRVAAYLSWIGSCVGSNVYHNLDYGVRDRDRDSDRDRVRVSQLVRRFHRTPRLGFGVT